MRILNKIQNLPSRITPAALRAEGKRWGGRGYRLLRFLILLSLGYLVLYPILYMVGKAFIPMKDAYDPSIVWVPKRFSLENFGLALTAMDYGKAFATTLLIPVLSGVLEVFTCAIPAYGLARYSFRGKKLLFALVMLTVIVPSQALIIPMYLNYAHLDVAGVLGLFGQLTGVDLRINVLGTAWTFYLPSLLGVGLRSGLFIFIYRQFFKGLPQELEEAAWIDGCGPFHTFIRIVLPTSGTAILCVFLFSLIWHWNEYYMPAMYLFDKDVLSVRLNLLTDVLWSTRKINGIQANNVVMSGCLLFITPVLLLYAWIQKWFIQSIERVGIVG